MEYIDRAGGKDEIGLFCLRRAFSHLRECSRCLAASNSLAFKTCSNEVALWSDTVRKSPGSARAWNNLGYAYQLAGRREEAGAAYERALALDPEDLKARVNLRGL